MGNLLGDEGRGITSVEEGLGEVSGVGVEVIWVTGDTPPPDGLPHTSFTNPVTNLIYHFQTHVTCSSSNLLYPLPVPSVMPSMWEKLEIVCPPE